MRKGHSKGLGKGKGKGKEGHKGGKGGYRSHQPRSLLAFGNGKGKGKPSFQGNFRNSKGKSKGSSSFGNRGKGKTSLPPTSEASTSAGVSSHTSIVCGFCHKIGHLHYTVIPCTNKLGENFRVGSNYYSQG
jgi:hypothetical protein